MRCLPASSPPVRLTSPSVLKAKEEAGLCWGSSPGPLPRDPQEGHLHGGPQDQCGTGSPPACCPGPARALQPTDMAPTWAPRHSGCLLLLGVPLTASCHFSFKGGDAKLLVILCVSPWQKHVAETLQSLGFGARARQVERGPPTRQRPR